MKPKLTYIKPTKETKAIINKLVKDFEPALKSLAGK
jgi:hypothetical protein